MKKFKELTKEELIQAIESVEYLGLVLTTLDCTDNSYEEMDSELVLMGISGEMTVEELINKLVEKYDKVQE